MTEPHTPSVFDSEPVRQKLRKRRAADRRFRLYGLTAVGAALAVLLLLLGSIIDRSLEAFSQHTVTITLTLDGASLPAGSEDMALEVQGFYEQANTALIAALPTLAGAPVQDREIVTDLALAPIAKAVANSPDLIGQPHQVELVVSDSADRFLKGNDTLYRLTVPAAVVASALAGDDADLRRAFAAPVGGEAAQGATVLLVSGTSVAVWTESGRAYLAEGTADAFQARPVQAHVLATREAQRKVSDRRAAFILALEADGRIGQRFNTNLFTRPDSNYPELGGIIAALSGSLFTMLVTALLAIPIGVSTAIYLEEYAPRNRLTAAIEVNINNLAAVPSIVFGLLGAAVFVNLSGWERSTPFVGGLVLGLLVLPTVIIASRAALAAVPRSTRSAALSIGASRTQSVFHFVLPMAAPGILTGAILAMARALGETAPLLLIGMFAFVGEAPGGAGDKSSSLPVLIYRWSTLPERAWEPMTAAAIVVLLVFLILMNGMAVALRRRFERRR